ncbi:P63C domain-containing protein [Sulfitobacter litoralis]|uniref:P63C domain-containing protein n=1 Tax=Sulfitobacter litoralis TaxID=335975 RepID=A0ABY0SR60_9RHOB|nr:P63C domain-containing protein [Sulfitobacter litoralis]SDP53109.1 P63C domain-containing protein [Sulfitobacter litoralis]
MDSNEKGRAAGGVARAESLSPKERSKIASEAAKARWSNTKAPTPDMPIVVEGYSSHIDLVDARLPCAVIEWPDGRIQRVLSENGITNAILGGRSGASKRLKSSGATKPLFLAPRQLEAFIHKDLEDGPLKPIEYVEGSRVVRGYDAEILVAVCAVWLRARAAGALQKQQLAKAQKAEDLTLALANTGVAALIDEATGYQDDRAKDALAKIFAQFLAKERQKWTLTFPLDFYREIYRLRGWKFEPWNTRRPQVIAKWTDDFVYDRLAPGLTEELRDKNPTSETGRRPHKHHQWFNPQRGHPQLKEHIAGVIALLRAAETWEEFKRKLNRVYPKFGETIEMKLDRG